MARMEHGAGISVSRINLVLGFTIIMSWTLGVIVFVLFLIADLSYSTNDSIMLVQQFYNSTSSEEACLAFPDYSEESYIGDRIENSEIINRWCTTAHDTFKSEYPDVASVYIMDYDTTLWDIDTDEDDYYESVFKVVARNNDGSINEELTHIKIPYQLYSNPYYQTYRTSDGTTIRNGDINAFFPVFASISYGGEELWQLR